MSQATARLRRQPGSPRRTPKEALRAAQEGRECLRRPVLSRRARAALRAAARGRARLRQPDEEALTKKAGGTTGASGFIRRLLRLERPVDATPADA